MEIRHGLISADSHVVLDKDAFARHMSKQKWGDRIPHIVEVARPNRSGDGERLVHRWLVYEQVDGLERDWGVSNCPAVMNDPNRKVYPERWEDVPAKVYDPLDRAEALDEDGVDAEVLFANDPARGGFFRYGDPEFELDCVRAYNDALAEWREASDRFVPLTMIPYLSGIEGMVKEVERAAKLGHRGIDMLAEPSRSARGAGLKHFNDPCWDPLWAACQDLEMPVHFHAGGGIGVVGLRWEGYTTPQAHTATTTPTAAGPAMGMANIVFSGICERFPRVKWVSAEAGIGWVPHVIEACEHEWERRRLWTHGLLTRPREIVHRQMYFNFWYEVANMPIRHWIGIDNIMWESDYPHTTSTYPTSWEYVERSLAGVPDEERRKMMYENAIRLYRL